MRINKVMQRIFQKEHADFVAEIFREWFDQEPAPHIMQPYIHLLAQGMPKKNVLFEILYSKQDLIGKKLAGINPPDQVCLNTLDWINSFYHGADVRKRNCMILDTENTSIRYDVKSLWPSYYHYKFKQFMLDPLQQFVAIVPSGRVIGPNGAVCTPDNQLLWDISLEYNKQPNQHSIFSANHVPPAAKTSETLAVLTSIASSNYYHWMFDVLSRLDLLRRSGIAIDRYVINRQGSFAFQDETLAALGIPKEKLIDCNSQTHIEARNLVVSSMPGCMGNVPKWVCDFLRRELLFNRGIKPIVGFERIYITRAHTKYRKVKNEEAVIRMLKSLGFRVVATEFLSVREEAQIFSSAKVVVAPHGAGLTNIIFCRPGTKVVEIFAPNYVHPVFWVPSRHLELDYYYFTGEGQLDPANSLNVVEDIVVDLGKLTETLKFAGVIH